MLPIFFLPRAVDSQEALGPALCWFALYGMYDICNILMKQLAPEIHHKAFPKLDSRGPGGSKCRTTDNKGCTQGERRRSEQNKSLSFKTLIHCNFKIHKEIQYQERSLTKSIVGIYMYLFQIHGLAMTFKKDFKIIDRDN